MNGDQRRSVYFPSPQGNGQVSSAPSHLGGDPKGKGTFSPSDLRPPQFPTQRVDLHSQTSQDRNQHRQPTLQTTTARNTRQTEESENNDASYWDQFSQRAQNQTAVPNNRAAVPSILEGVPDKDIEDLLAARMQERREQAAAQQKKQMAPISDFFNWYNEDLEEIDEIVDHPLNPAPAPSSKEPTRSSDPPPSTTNSSTTTTTKTTTSSKETTSVSDSPMSAEIIHSNDSPKPRGKKILSNFAFRKAAATAAPTTSIDTTTTTTTTSVSEDLPPVTVPSAYFPQPAAPSFVQEKDYDPFLNNRNKKQQEEDEDPAIDEEAEKANPIDVEGIFGMTSAAVSAPTPARLRPPESFSPIFERSDDEEEKNTGQGEERMEDEDDDDEMFGFKRARSKSPQKSPLLSIDETSPKKHRSSIFSLDDDDEEEKDANDDILSFSWGSITPITPGTGPSKANNTRTFLDDDDPL